MGDEADALYDAAMDWYDQYGDGSEDGHRETRCRDCGSHDVYWAQEDGRWVLYGTDSRKHRCDKRKLSRIRLNAFDSLD